MSRLRCCLPLAGAGTLPTSAIFTPRVVPELLVVDVDEPSLVALALVGDGYQEVARVADDEPYAATEPFVVRAIPADLVR